MKHPGGTQPALPKGPKKLRKRFVIVESDAYFADDHLRLQISNRRCS